MEEFKDKTNNEIILEMKQMEHDYEALKTKMLNDWDRLLGIEDKYAKAAKLIKERLKGK